MKIVMIAIFALVLAGCGQVDTGVQFLDIDRSNVAVRYENGALRYMLEVHKPTPCHRLEIEELIMESFPVQVRVTITTIPPGDDIICIQVIGTETVERQIEIDYEPGSVTIFVDGSRVY
jgi:hypothetical protein